MKKVTNQKISPPIFNADDYLATGMPKRQILELKDAFDLLDTSNKGTIDPNELNSLINAYGVESKNQSLTILVNESVYSGKPLDFTAFLHIFTSYFYTPKIRQNYKKVFRIFDDENIGCISAKNLRRVMKQLQLQIDETQIQQMIDRADLDNDGVISEEEFYQIMTRISTKV